MHENTAEYLRWMVLLPLLGAVLNGLLNKRLPNAVVSLFGVGSVAGSFILAVKAFLDLRALEPAQRILYDEVYRWIAIGDLQVDVAFSIDPLSACMILLVTGVGLLIHIYSTGYMKGDGGYARYFAYLNLFVFSMLALVSADNLLLLFLGWEGVGLCSYLLIGFWYEDLANSVAGKKAFVVNRIGDFGFLIGMFLIFRTLVGHVDDGASVFSFAVMREHAALLAPIATAAGILLFVGATGKSAQIPLYVWLPDAMAGPTPVSALIHAATMVTAGVYMMARMNFLYDLTPAALGVVAVIGGLTAFLAATIALAQTDIKKVLAYSTVSQLGYMFMACGVGAYGIGVFHVLTHGFFKALLFLGAGAVIHSLHHEQDMRNMGGLATRMPWTYRTMLVATLAIAGIFPFAGFFSKDEILYKVFLENPGLWALGFLVAGLTAFYMARLIAMTFLGARRGSEHGAEHVHEAPPSMLIPLLALGLLSVIGGWMGWPEFLGGANQLHHWLEPVFAGAGAHAAEVGQAVGDLSHGTGVVDEHAVEHTVAHAAGHSVLTEWILALASLSLALLSLGAGLVVYTRRPDLPERARQWAAGAPHRLLAGKYYVDELYDALIVRPIGWLSDRLLWRVVDAGLIDGLLVNGSARVLGVFGHLFRLVQNGFLRWYAYSFAAGVVLLLVYAAQRF